jgi:hypothetical protein
MSIPTLNSERKSYYEFINSQNDKRNNVGYAYEGNIFKRTLSRLVYNGDENRSYILAKIEKVVFTLIEKTKGIKNFVNYTVPKNNKYVR